MAAVVVPGVAGQGPVDPSLVGEAVNPVLDQVVPLVEDTTHEDVTSESVGLDVHLEVTNAEVDILGILLAGGKAESDIRARVNLSFRAVSVERLDAALAAATGDANTSLEGTFGLNSSRLALTAEELRLAGGGALLAAFQTYQEDATRTLIEETVPGVTVLRVRFDWSNVLPGERPRDGREPDLREPPLLLEADITMRFLDRYSLVDILEARDREQGEAEDAHDRLRRQIEANQTLPFSQRSAFMVLGLNQLLDLDVPPGWTLQLMITVPKPFIVAGASDALQVSEDGSRATYAMDGSERMSAHHSAGVASVSNRLVVTLFLLAGMLLVGYGLRVPAELAGIAVARRRDRRLQTRDESAHRDDDGW